MEVAMEDLMIIVGAAVVEEPIYLLEHSVMSQLLVVVVLAILETAPMEGIQTEVPPAIQMEELKQQGGMVNRIGTTVGLTIVEVGLDQVVMQRLTVAVAVVEVVTMEVERDGMV